MIVPDDKARQNKIIIKCNANTSKWEKCKVDKPGTVYNGNNVN